MSAKQDVSLGLWQLDDWSPFCTLFPTSFVTSSQVIHSGEYFSLSQHQLASICPWDQILQSSGRVSLACEVWQTCGWARAWALVCHVTISTLYRGIAFQMLLGYGYSELLGGWSLFHSVRILHSINCRRLCEVCSNVALALETIEMLQFLMKLIRQYCVWFLIYITSLISPIWYDCKHWSRAALDAKKLMFQVKEELPYENEICEQALLYRGVLALAVKIGCFTPRFLVTLPKGRCQHMHTPRMLSLPIVMI